MNNNILFHMHGINSIEFSFFIVSHVLLASKQTTSNVNNNRKNNSFYFSPFSSRVHHHSRKWNRKCIVCLYFLPQFCLIFVIISIGGDNINNYNSNREIECLVSYHQSKKNSPKWIFSFLLIYNNNKYTISLSIPFRIHNHTIYKDININLCVGFIFWLRISRSQTEQKFDTESYHHIWPNRNKEWTETD